MSTARTACSRTPFKGGILACIDDLDTPPPAWSWVELRPGAGLGPNAEPIDKRAPSDLLRLLLRQGAPALPDGLNLEEARLFWPWGSIHLVEDKPGVTRWMLWAMPQEDEAAKALCERLDATELEFDSDGDLERRLLRTDLSRRFGLPEVGLYGSETKLRVRLLHCNGALIAWTLKAKEG